MYLSRCMYKINLKTKFKKKIYSVIARSCSLPKKPHMLIFASIFYSICAQKKYKRI